MVALTSGIQGSTHHNMTMFYPSHLIERIQPEEVISAASGIHSSTYQKITMYMATHSWEGQLVEQIQPEEISKEMVLKMSAFGGQINGDPFAVNTVEEMEQNIRQVQNNMQELQNIALTGGKCLRILAIGIKGMISTTGCKIAQIIDRATAAEFTKFLKYQRCDEGEKSLFCRKIDYIEGLEKAAVAQSDIFSAQNKVAEINGRERTELFKP